MSQQNKDGAKDQGEEKPRPEEKPKVDPRPEPPTEVPPAAEGDERFRASVDADRGRFAIRTPNPGFRGDRAGVRFMDGVGYTDDAKIAKALRDLGYVVTEHKR